MKVISERFKGDPLLTPAEAGRYCNCHYRTLRRRGVRFLDMRAKGSKQAMPRIRLSVLDKYISMWERTSK